TTSISRTRGVHGSRPQLAKIAEKKGITLFSRRLLRSLRETGFLCALSADVLFEQFVRPAHPIGEQEIGSVVCAARTVPTVQRVRISVPLPHRDLVVGQDDERLR